MHTAKHNQLVDITQNVEEVVRVSRIETGLVNVYVQGVTAGIMIQENWDESVQGDVNTFLENLIPAGVWKHDEQDDNGDSHLKAGLVVPSETIPLINGKMGLSTRQNIFLYEFDGPHEERRIVVTIFDAVNNG